MSQKRTGCDNTNTTTTTTTSRSDNADHTQLPCCGGGCGGKFGGGLALSLAWFDFPRSRLHSRRTLEGWDEREVVATITTFTPGPPQDPLGPCVPQDPPRAPQDHPRTPHPSGTPHPISGHPGAATSELELRDGTLASAEAATSGTFVREHANANM